MMFKKCDTDFDLDRHLIPYLQEVPFFAELSRQIRKTPTTDAKMKTAAVSFNSKMDEIILFWNPEFFKTLSNWQVRGVLTHEFYHLVFGHLNIRRKNPDHLWNVATDLAINSIIYKNSRDTQPRDASSSDTPLPGFALRPGHFPTNFDGTPLSPEKKAQPLTALIANLPDYEASEFYFNKLLEEQQKQGGEGGFGEGESGPESMDDHSMWDDVPEEMREYVEGRIKSIIERAVKYADSHPSGWGNMPSDIVTEIRRSVSYVVDWRSVLRQFIGSTIRGRRTTSIKKINKKYPYIHPGFVKGYQAKLLIALDQSGSVDDEMLEMFFAELRTLNKKVEFDVLPFDWTAEESQIKTWNKGAVPKIKRVKCGGTSFDAPTAIYNDPKNRGRWDGLLIATDGECSAPQPVRGKRGWVLGKGRKLMFETTELQIFLDKNSPMFGAWR